MKTILYCLLDKEYPPEHSFVDGMLASELPESGIIVRLIVSKGSCNSNSVVRYKRAACLPILLPRKGFKRFLNFIPVLFLLNKAIKKEKEKKRRLVILVRNEPVFLLAACILKKRIDQILFQQSFPHEVREGGFTFKGVIAAMIFRLTASRVDTLLAVSPLGLKRLRKYFGSETKGLVIPLLGYKIHRSNFEKNNFTLSADEPVRFVYAGSHSKLRKLDFVIKGIIQAYKSNINATFSFIGGEIDEQRDLKNIHGVRELENESKIKFIGNLSRNDYLEMLTEYHVGLSIIPPEKIYIEASPSKLAEYMFCGLAVIASKGIPMQEDFIRKSCGGMLVEWSEEEIAEAIRTLSNDRIKLSELRMKANTYALQNLSYKNRTNEMLSILLELKRKKNDY